MRVYARHQKDVVNALDNLRDYREIAETQGAIRPSSPLSRLTEARHALQSALMPQDGALPYQQPARRQRDIIRAVEEITRAAQQFAQEDVRAHNVAIDMTGPMANPRHTTLAAIDERTQAIAAKLTKANAANQDFLDKRLVSHVSDALTALNHVEQSYNHNGPGATTQALAIAAAGNVLAVAYTQEAKHEGASLSARHETPEFADLRQASGLAPRAARPAP